MRRARWRAGATVAALALAPTGLGGCTLSPVPVVVAGIDREGNPVVGGTDCSFSPEQIEGISVQAPGDLGMQDVWTITRPVSGGDSSSRRSDPTDPRGRRPPPVPRALDEVTLIAVGDRAPAGWIVRRPLVRPLPELGTLLVSFERGFEPTVELDLDLRAEPDTFTASIDGRRVDDLTAEDLAARIEETCDEATAFDGGRFWSILGGTVGGVVLLWLGAGLLTARQWRRAKEPSR